MIDCFLPGMHIAHLNLEFGTNWYFTKAKANQELIEHLEVLSNDRRIFSQLTEFFLLFAVICFVAPIFLEHEDVELL